jgi:hypothetical protein
MLTIGETADDNTHVDDMQDVSLTLKITQTAAVLEVVHAMLGLSFGAFSMQHPARLLVVLSNSSGTAPL